MRGTSVAEKGGHIEARQQRSGDASKNELPQSRMAERTTDQQICLALQGGCLNDAGDWFSIRLYSRDIDGKSSPLKRGRKAVAAVLVDLLVVGDGNQDDA